MKHAQLTGEILAAVLAALITGGGALAQAPDPKKPAQPGAKQPMKADAKAAAVVNGAAKAVGDLRGFSYRVKVTGKGAAAGKTPDYAALVVASRAEAGGWKLYVKGDVASEGKTAPFEVAFDGVIARSLIEDEKTVVERSFKDMTDLPTFFSGQKAGAVVAWEMLTEKPFADAAARASHEGVVPSDDGPLDMVYVASSGAAAEAGTEAGVRYAFGVDRLPRTITRVLRGAGDEPAGERVLTIMEFKRNEEAVRAPFSIPVPDGYRVRVQPSRTTARKPVTPQDGDKPAAPAPANGLLAVGTVAPEWSLKDDKGRTHKLSDYKGKVVLMDFWATWCGPCKAAMPGVQRLHEKFKGKGVAVFGMNCWERGDAAAYMRDKRFSYGLLLNADSVATAYQVKGIPTFYVIGPDGKILWNAVGSSPAHEKEIGEVIEKALKT